MGKEAATGSAALRIGEPVSPRPKVSVRPVRVHHYDDRLACTLSRTVGFRARCSCGWRGKVRRHRSDAGGDAAEHKGGHE